MAKSIMIGEGKGIIDYEEVLTGIKIVSLLYRGGGDFVIPEEIEGKPVSILDAKCAKNVDCECLYVPNVENLTLQAGCFSFSKHIKKIHIPPAVRVIRQNCFMQSNVTAVTGMENVEVVEEAAFKQSNIVKIIWPDKCHHIPDGCFSDCKSLTTVENIDHVTDIGSEAFFGCSSLHSMKWPSACTKVQGGCFAEAGLTSIDNLNHVETIEGAAFMKTNLDSFTWPDNCPVIPFNCFAHTKLKEIDSLDSVEEIGAYAFRSAEVNSVMEFKNDKCSVKMHSSSFYNAKIKSLNMESISDCVVIKDINEDVFPTIDTGFDTIVSIMDRGGF